MNPSPTPALPEMASLAALRGRHRELLREATDEGPARRAEILAFLTAATRAGRVIESRPDRSAAQALLDYWMGFLLARSDQAATDLPEALLEPFDPEAAPDLADRDSPYLGLAAFGVAEAERFFGRQEAKESLYRAVKASPVVVVAGPSGSGKSSLVRAGLLARVAADAEGLGQLALPEVIPGADPLGALLRALLGRPDPGKAELEAARKALEADPSAVLALAAAGRPRRPLLLVVDQLEELFSLCHDHAARLLFAAAVVAFAGAPGAHRVVLTVRDDYLKRLFALPAFAPLQNEPGALFAPAPLSPAELREVIVRPAEMVGLKFDEGIVDDLVQEVRDEPTALPLLQFALQRLWEKRERNRIGWEVYRAVGKPGEALQRTADEVYLGLPQELDRQVARLIFEDLVEPAVGIELVRRRVGRELLRRHASAGVVDTVLERFENVGLLRRTPGSSREEDRFEVAHEALIRNWPLLSSWLAEARERRQERLRFRALAELSRSSGWDPGTLLGGEVLKRSEAYPDLDPLEKEFLLRSNQAQDAQQRDKERQLARKIRDRNLTILIIVTVFTGAFYQIHQTLQQERMARHEASEARAAAELARRKAEQARDEVQAASQECFLYKQGVASFLKSPEALDCFASRGRETRGDLESLIRIIETSERPALPACGDRVDDGVSPHWKSLFAGREEILARVLRATGRVERKQGNEFFSNSSGFLVAPDLLLVFGERPLEAAHGGAAGADYWVNFEAESGCPRRAGGPERYPLGQLVLEFPADRDWPFGVYRVEGLDPARRPLELSFAGPEGLAGRTVFTVGHPSLGNTNLPAEAARLILGDGGPGVKRLSPGQLVGATAEVLTHDCTTMAGSGGGPLVDLETGKVLGVHVAKAGNTTVTPQRNLAAPLASFPGLEHLVAAAATAAAP